MKYCINCGAPNVDEADYCFRCGCPTDDVVPQARKPYPDDFDPVGPSVEQSQDTTEFSSTAVRWKRSSPNTARVAITTLCCFAILMIGTLAFFNRGNIGIFVSSILGLQDDGIDSSSGTSEEIITITFNGNGADRGNVGSIVCAVGEQVILPDCSYIREGYAFDCWEDADGNPYAPGDKLYPEENMIFWVRWKADTSGTSNGNTTINGNTNDPAYLAANFPRSWAGTYTGYSQYVEGGTINRTERIVFSSVESSGKLHGICYIGANDPEAGTGSYYVEGYIDWNAHTITLRGTTWYDQNEVKYMRSYSGIVNDSFDTITGTCTTLDGDHTGAWSLISEE